MGKAITEIDSYAGPISGTTKLPVSDSDTLQAGTASQVLTYIVANLGNAATKNTGTTAGTVAAGDHAHSGYAATGAIGSSGLTMATAKLLGRSTAGTGTPEEITLGTNLSFTGTTLNASGGSATPGGSDTQVQVNNAGAFAGYAKLVWKSSTSELLAGDRLALGTSGGLNPTLSYSGNTLYVVSGNGGVWSGIKAASYFFSAGGSVCSLGSEMYTSLNAGTDIGGTFTTRGLALCDASNVRDVSLFRSSSGVAELNNGTAGTFRDLKLRNLIGTGNLATGAVAKTAGYTATTSDGTIEVDASGAARTITLFATSGNAGKIIVVKKTDSSANAVTVDGNASETIDGATTIILASQYSTAILQVNAAGTGWNKLGGV